jgi:hypothetical protein
MDGAARLPVRRHDCHHAGRPANQAVYPQVYNQKPGLGFPIARLGALTSLACGALVNLGFGRYAGKGQGEVSLLRRLWDVLRPGGSQGSRCHPSSSILRWRARTPFGRRHASLDPISPAMGISQAVGKL